MRVLRFYLIYLLVGTLSYDAFANFENRVRDAIGSKCDQKMETCTQLVKEANDAYESIENFGKKYLNEIIDESTQTSIQKAIESSQDVIVDALKDLSEESMEPRLDLIKNGKKIEIVIFAISVRSSLIPPQVPKAQMLDDSKEVQTGNVIIVDRKTADEVANVEIIGNDPRNLKYNLPVKDLWIYIYDDIVFAYKKQFYYIVNSVMPQAIKEADHLTRAEKKRMKSELKSVEGIFQIAVVQLKQGFFEQFHEFHIKNESMSCERYINAVVAEFNNIYWHWRNDVDPSFHRIENIYFNLNEPGVVITASFGKYLSDIWSEPQGERESKIQHFLSKLKNNIIKLSEDILEDSIARLDRKIIKAFPEDPLRSDVQKAQRNININAKALRESRINRHFQKFHETQKLYPFLLTNLSDVDIATSYLHELYGNMLDDVYTDFRLVLKAHELRSNIQIAFSKKNSRTIAHDLLVLLEQQFIPAIYPFVVKKLCDKTHLVVNTQIWKYTTNLGRAAAISAVNQIDALEQVFGKLLTLLSGEALSEDESKKVLQLDEVQRQIMEKKVEIIDSAIEHYKTVPSFEAIDTIRIQNTFDHYIREVNAICMSVYIKHMSRLIEIQAEVA